MKKVRKICAALLFAILVQAAALEAVPAMRVQAAQDGLVVKGGHSYYYQDNKKVTNTWKNVTVDGKKYRYYFGSSGAAYQAKKLYKDAYNVKVYKIDKKEYGFDNYAHLAEPGIYVDSMYRFVVIGKNGVYNGKASKKLCKQMKIQSDGGKISKKKRDQVVSLLGKPVSVKRSSSCDPWNNKDKFTDVTLIYRHFEVLLIMNNRTKEYALSGYFPR